MPATPGGQDWLSSTLRDLRKRADLSGREVAGHLGTSQRRISNIETGRFIPRPDEVRELAALYRAPAPLRRQLGQAVADLRDEPVKARVVMSRGAWHMQERIASVESSPARNRWFHSAVVIVLVPTEAYSRRVLNGVGDIVRDD